MRSSNESQRQSVDAGSSKTLTRSLKMLEIVALHSQGPMRLAEVVQASGSPKTTCHRLLGVLCANGLLRMDREGRYAPGPLLLSMGMNFLRQTDVRTMALPAMQELTDSTRETCHLGLMHFPWVVYLEKVESPHAVRMHSQVGAMNPLHSTGLGKALLAFAPPDLIDQVCSGPLPAITEHTITDGQALRVELECIRNQGFAIDDLENEAGIRCVGAPILGHEGQSIAAISIAGPETRLTPKVAKELAPRVSIVAQNLSAQSGFTGRLSSSPQR